MAPPAAASPDDWEMPPTRRPSASRVLAWLTPVAGVLLFAVALGVLHRELRHVDYRVLTATIRGVPGLRLLLALALTVANYGVLTAYDHLAFVYIRRRLDALRVTLASFVAYALANNVGFALLSGGAVRYRFYSRWGLSAGDLSRVVFCYSTTYWLGLMALSGWSLAVEPLPGLVALLGQRFSQTLGLVLLGSVVAYLLATLLKREPVRIRGFELALPRPHIGAAQLGVSVVDWVLAGSALHALLPEGSVPLSQLMGAFVAAQILGLVSHVPGGLGVFESGMVLLLKPDVEPAVLLPALVLFRFVYYLVPLVLAMAVLLVDEVLQRRDQVVRLRTFFGAVSDELAPRVLAVFTFMAGAVLLFSGATPAEPARMALLAGVVPLSLVELAHVTGSLAGVGLLLVSHGVARRLQAAYGLALYGLAGGVMASLLKGADYEEAGLLALLLLLLLKADEEFDRHEPFFATRFSASWALAVAGVLGASVWLGVFAYKHAGYTATAWWRFSAEGGDLPRFLRASAAAVSALAAFAVARWRRPAPEPARPAGAPELAKAERVIAAQPGTAAFLACLGDKALLFAPADDAFVMYGVHGRTWAALGDPVGPRDAAPALIRAFIERCFDYGGQPVFYEASEERLPQYADFGLAAAKIGDEAHVPLADFSLADAHRAVLREAVDRVRGEGVRFIVRRPEDVGPLLPSLRAVSDEWLAGRRERRFSVGFFDEAYLRRFPVAVLERGGETIGFATLWPGAGGVELSADLMRFRRTAIPGVLDAMLAELMVWGRAHGFRWFNLGMAPLSVSKLGRIAPLWTRLGGWVHRHGEAFYDVHGLRAYKQRFDPEWSARYVAYPGGLALARVLADVASLVAGETD